MLTICRIVLLVISIVSIVILCNRLRLNRPEWTQKTTEYWIAQFVWSIAGTSFAMEGLLRHPPFRVTLVFVLFAAAVNLIALRRKGPWGTNNVR